MHIKSITLNNFRNYENLNLEFHKGVNIFIGDNAQGKTNIVESIYYCSIGKSNRTSKDKELIKWKKTNAYINLYVSRERIDKKIEIKIFNEGKKGINVNSIKLKKISELFGVFNAVMFSPEDLKIVKESPSYRRRFLDIELSKIYPRYYFDLVQYNKVLEERNALLRSRNSSAYEMLQIYDLQLSRFGSSIIKHRINYIIRLNEIGKNIHKEITQNKEDIQFNYSIENKSQKEIEEDLYNKLEKNRSKDIVKGITSVGPHRDDFNIEINGIDTKIFGSQGQQRTAVLTIKFATIDILKKDTGEVPVLLLDDVLSELDISRQKYILNSLDSIQTIITCTGINDIQSYLYGQYKLFNVKDGIVTEVK
jgi:DNA replication and repair protein RecF